MTDLAAALLGVVQGLTEFLPVSSSAHLILARTYFGWDAEAFGLAFDVACHIGTLLAVIAFFRADVAGMLVALRAPFEPSDGARRIRRLVAGTLPVLLVGGLLGGLVTRHLRTPVVAGVTLAVGGFLLLVAERRSARTRDERSLSLVECAGLGFAQAAALVPGVSRSGATITLGLLLGLRRDEAARFAFLLGIPAILAAGAKAGLDLAGTPLGADTLRLFAIGIVTSAAVGYVTIKYFLRFVAARQLDVFAYYRLVVAGTVALWWLTR